MGIDVREAPALINKLIRTHRTAVYLCAHILRNIPPRWAAGAPQITHTHTNTRTCVHEAKYESKCCVWQRSRHFAIARSRWIITTLSYVLFIGTVNSWLARVCIQLSVCVCVSVYAVACLNVFRCGRRIAARSVCVCVCVLLYRIPYNGFGFANTHETGSKQLARIIVSCGIVDVVHCVCVCGIIVVSRNV